MRSNDVYFDSLNSTGMLHRLHSGKDLNTNTRYNFMCYYITNSDNIIERPRLGVGFGESINKCTRTFREAEGMKRQRTSGRVARGDDNIDSRNSINTVI